MIRLGNIRDKLEEVAYCEIIYNLDGALYSRYEQEYQYIYELLWKPDNYMIPYNCYEVLYDWDDYGAGDGADVVCFYSDKVGYLAKNEKAREVYGEPDEEE